MSLSDWYSGKTVDFNDKMCERYQAIENAKNNHQKAVVLQTITNFPSSINDRVDINCTEDGKAWLKSYQNYFDIIIIMDCGKDKGFAKY